MYTHPRYSNDATGSYRSSAVCPITPRRCDHRRVRRRIVDPRMAGETRFNGDERLLTDKNNEVPGGEKVFRKGFHLSMTDSDSSYRRHDNGRQFSSKTNTGDTNENRNHGTVS